MMKLTNNQKKHLRKLAHNLRPIVMVGQQGLSDAVLDELESTMTKHEPVSYTHLTLPTKA